ncbi:MAG: ROK family transcriptional regulator [Chloroflexi bacterium]|nr:MAG: ROK family transcriptional regulator [Chloroflexota bacterium]
MSAEIDSTPGTPRLLRALNERALLGHLRRDGPASRAQLARTSGLSKVTVSLTMANLERAGLVRVAGSMSPGRGRLAVLYEPDPTAGHVVGVDIGRAWVRCALADLSGAIVGRRDVPNRARSASGLVESVAGVARAVVAEAGLSWDQVVHTLIGSPGVFDSKGGRVQFAPNLPGWGRAGLVEELRRALGSSLDLENDANLAAIGEGAFGAGVGVGTFVFLTVGTGLGMGVVVNGRLHRGARGAAGEVAFLPVGADGEPGAPQASAPAANRRGLFEEAAAADAVVRTAVALGMTGARSAQAVFEAARRGDPAARRAVELEGERLALAVAAVAAVLDPELVVLGGGIGRNLDLLQDALVRRLHEVTPLRPAVVVSQLGDDVVLRGAIATALDLARELVFERRAGGA